MELRDAAAADADGIASVVMAVWRHNYDDVVDPRALAALDPADERDRWRARLTAAPDATGRFHVGVVEHDGRVLGVVAVIACSREPDVAPGVGELVALDVHPVAQGAGLGGRIHDAALATLRGLDVARATARVLAADEAAQRFLAARGWSRDDDAPAAAPEDDAAGPTERWTRAI